MNLKEERRWWEVRVKWPFVGDLQKHLDRFQEKLIVNGEPPITVLNSAVSEDSILGFSVWRGEV